MDLERRRERLVRTLARRRGFRVERARTERRHEHSCGGLRLVSPDGRVVVGEDFDADVVAVERALLDEARR